MDDVLTFTGQQAAKAQTALREALGLPPENFPVQAFIGMISDEIEQLRAAGRDGEAIAALVSAATGKAVASTRPPNSEGINTNSISAEAFSQRSIKIPVQA